MNALTRRPKHLFPKDQERAVTDGRDLPMGDPMDGLCAQSGPGGHSRPVTTLSQEPVAEGVEFVHEPILDFKVAKYKTQKPDARTYASAMDDIKKNVAEALDSLIGEGKRFARNADVARRAHTIGVTDKQESFAKNLERLRTGRHDSRISTIEGAARAVDVSPLDLVNGKNFSSVNTDSEDSHFEHQSSLQSVRLDRARNTGEEILKATSEMRALLEQLLDLDRRGGAEREMALAGIGYILQGIPPTPANPDQAVNKKKPFEPK